MVKKIVIISIIIPLLFTAYLYSETLWDDKAANLYSLKLNYKIGDPIQVLIEEENSIKYKSGTQSLKTYNLEIKGGEMSAMFDFIPEGKVEETKNSRDNDEFNIVNSVKAVITNISGNIVDISGSKLITLNNKTSSIELTGRVNIRDIVNSTIFSKDVMEKSIRITTLLENSEIIISTSDLEKTTVNPDATDDVVEETKLNDTKKEELLLEYFNKILNLVF